MSFPRAGSEPDAGLAPEGPDTGGLEEDDDDDEDDLQKRLKSVQQFLKSAQLRLHWQGWFLSNLSPHLPSHELGFFAALHVEV